MPKDKIVIGTRTSKLALWQAKFVARKLREAYPELQIEERRMKTTGDKILDAPLAKIGGKGLFTKELEDSMLNGEIDIAVHSLKDMPTEVPEGLIIGTITSRYDAGDALVSNRYDSLAALPKGARVGTSSLRRKAQLLAARADLEIVDLRGNVNTRLAKLDAGEYDAIVLAVAGLRRLGFDDRVAHIIDRKLMLPAVGQGALAIECRIEDKETLQIIECLKDEEMTLVASAERAFLRRLEGGCQVPVGVFAEVIADKLRLEALIASLDGKVIYRDSKECIANVTEAEKLGINLAEDLLYRGGKDILLDIGIEVK